MSTSLASHRYGKSHIRLVKVRRDREPHGLVDLTIDVQLEGAFESIYTSGDNTSCIATDTMKNTVYALARQHDLVHVETFGERLGRHFLEQPAVSRARISAAEHRWDHASVGGRPHPHAFTQPTGERRTADVVVDRNAVEVTSGLANLVVLKTTDSAFAGFPRDRFTTLHETDDRILATSITASWRYRPGMTDFGARARIREGLIRTFAAHESRSVQHTLYAMAEAALDTCADIDEVTLRLPNRHHLLVDLEPFGLDNPNEVYLPTEEPHGLIEATLRRS